MIDAANWSRPAIIKHMENLEMNTTLIPHLTLDRVVDLAEWQAKRALAEGRSARATQFAKHSRQMYDILEASHSPHAAAGTLVRRLGRAKAAVLKIDRGIINMALDA